MPTKKIANLPKGATCTSPEHRPPSHQVFEDGVYEHTCPQCGLVISFVVSSPKWAGDAGQFYFGVKVW